MAYDGTLKFDTKVETSGFEQGVHKISNIAGSAMKATAAVITTAATAIAGVGTACLKMGAEFDSSMSNVAAISGAAANEMDKLREKALEMGEKTKFSATEAADAFSYMAMAGWKTGDMLSGIEGIMSLSAASGADLARTSDIVTDALTAFGMQAKESGHFADILAAASSNANTNVELMGETFKYAAPVAGALGLSAEDTAVAIGLMANAGIKGSMAGTALRSTLTRMVKPTKESQMAMDKLGFTATNADGSMKSLAQMTDELRAGFANLTDAEKAETAAQLAGQQGMSGLLAIVNASEKDYKKLREAVDGCTDSTTGYSAAAEMAAKQMDNLEGDIILLKSAVGTFAITVSDQLKGACRGVVQEVTEMVKELTSAFKDGGWEGLVKKAGEIFAQLAEEALKAAPKLIDAATSLIVTFLDAIINDDSDFGQAAGTVIVKLAEAFITVSGKLWEVGIILLKQILQGIAENAEDIGRTAAEVVKQLAQTISENWPEIKAAAIEIVKGFIAGIEEEWPGVGALLDGFVQGFSETLGGIADGVASVIKDIFKAINEADPDEMRALGESLGNIAAAFVAISAAKSVISVFSGVAGTVKTMSGIIGKLAEHLPAMTTLIPKFCTAWDTVTGAISGAASAVGEFIAAFGSIIAGVAMVIGGLILAVKEFVDQFQSGFDIIKEILMGVGLAIAAVGAIILGVPAAIAAAVAAVVGLIATAIILVKQNWEDIKAMFIDIKDVIVEFFSSIPEKVSEVVSEIGEFFASIPEKIHEALSSAAEKVAEWGANLKEKFSEAGTKALEAVQTFFFETLPHAIGYALGYVIGTIASWVLEVVQFVTVEVPKIIDAIVEWFKELPGKVEEWFDQTVEKVKEWAVTTYENMKEAAKNAIEAAVEWFKELPSKVKEWFDNTVEKVSEWAKATYENMKKAAEDAINAVVEWFRELPAKVKEWLDETIQKAVEWGKDLLEKGKQAAKDLVDAVVDGVKELPDKMMELGKNIVDGVWQGIQNAKDHFMESVHSFFSGIIDGAKDALGINSPSKIARKMIGRWIPPGIGLGIEDAMPDLEKEVKGDMLQLAQEMEKTVKLNTGDITLATQATQQNKQEISGKIDDAELVGKLKDDRKDDPDIMAGAIKQALNGTAMVMDGEKVGDLITERVNENIGVDADRENER